MPSPRDKIRTCFKRLETDAEFAKRLRAMGFEVSASDGQYWLDRVGDAYGAQRKIVEDVA